MAKDPARSVLVFTGGFSEKRSRREVRRGKRGPAAFEGRRPWLSERLLQNLGGGGLSGEPAIQPVGPDRHRGSRGGSSPIGPDGLDSRPASLKQPSR